LLFIGSYKHEPNVDAVLWFCRDIFPLIRREHPDITLTLLGSDPPPEVRHLQSKDVNVTGYVADVTEYFLQSKVFVCPLLFGAGVKGKVGQSLSFGLPVVSTSVGVEGMNVEAGCEALVADTAEEFARAVLQAYTDETLWNNLSAQGYKMVEEYSGERLRGLIDTLFKDLESRGNGTAAE
jgi:glycosyltransferase involved in cell wall biosynthesis